MSELFTGKQDDESIGRTMTATLFDIRRQKTGLKQWAEPMMLKRMARAIARDAFRPVGLSQVVQKFGCTMEVALEVVSAGVESGDLVLEGDQVSKKRN